MFNEWHVAVTNVIEMRTQLTLALQHQHKSILKKVIKYLLFVVN